MAGFFGFFDPSKPGKGVDVNAPPKHPFFLFFELVWRKLGKLVTLNMTLFVIVFPIVTILYMGYYSLAETLIPSDLLQMPTDEEIVGGAQVVTPYSFLPTILLPLMFSLPMPVFVALLALSVIFYGPAMCGLTYVLRNYSREEHAWYTDFFIRMWRNFRQGMIAGIVELAALVLLTYNITAVIDPAASDGSALFGTVIKMVSLLLMLIVFFARHYWYLIIVTFDLKLRQIWKNSLIFAILNLFKNLLVSVVILALALVVLSVPYMDILLVPFFFMTFSGFLTMFVCRPIVWKYMVRTEDEDSEETLALDEHDTEDES